MMTELEAEKIIKEKFESCRELLAEISKDSSNNEIMVEEPGLFLNYDKILKEFYRSGEEEIPKSPDMVIFRDNTIVFVEFKNGKIKGKEKDRVKLKAVEGGIIAFYKILAANEDDLSFFDILRLKKSYVLVYNTEKNPLNEIHDRVYSQTARFGLHILEGTLYNKVKTISPGSFSHWLNREESR